MSLIDKKAQYKDCPDGSVAKTLCSPFRKPGFNLIRELDPN